MARLLEDPRGVARLEVEVRAVHPEPRWIQRVDGAVAALDARDTAIGEPQPLIAGRERQRAIGDYPRPNRASEQ